MLIETHPNLLMNHPAKYGVLLASYSLCATVREGS